MHALSHAHVQRLESLRLGVRGQQIPGLLAQPGEVGRRLAAAQPVAHFAPGVERAQADPRRRARLRRGVRQAPHVYARRGFPVIRLVQEVGVDLALRRQPQGPLPGEHRQIERRRQVRPPLGFRRGRVANAHFRNDAVPGLQPGHFESAEAGAIARQLLKLRGVQRPLSAAALQHAGGDHLDLGILAPQRH